MHISKKSTTFAPEMIKTMKFAHSYSRVLFYVATLHVLCLLFMTLCRVIFFCANIPAEGADWTLLLTALLIGVKFDNLIACYVSALPFVFVPVWSLCTIHRPEYGVWLRRVMRGVAWYYGIVYALLLFVHVANARYYHFFDNHLNIGATEWFGFMDETAGLVFDDPVNWIFLAIAVVLIAVFEWCVSSLTTFFDRCGEHVARPTWQNYLWASVAAVLLWGLAFCGMRGSFQRYPLRVSFAYFSESPFYNKLGVNPVFNIIKSAEYGRVKIPKELAAIDEHEAIAYVQRELGIIPVDSLRPIVRPGTVHRRVDGQPNVVLIFMESMAAENLERKENGEWLTPYLRELRDKSVYWENCYSTGIHTNNGIVGVHYGFVPNFAKPIMDVNADLYTGLPYYLKKNGYETICFVTGNPQYDNMNSFWRDNSIQKIYSLYDYPSDALVNNFGVSDGYMFDFGLRKLEEHAATGKPFFASFLTVSNHAPFVVPEPYRNRAADPQEQIIAYADDALRKFMEAAIQTDWGKNTVFVLVADHGTNLPCPYEMLLPYHHIPVFILGAGIAPERLERPASQVDIWPTVLSLLGVEYENNSLGVDILNESRSYAFFVSDDHLGVSDGTWFWCYGLHTKRECLYRVGEAGNVLSEYLERTASMRAFGVNMQRVNLMAIEKKWTAPSE